MQITEYTDPIEFRTVLEKEFSHLWENDLMIGLVHSLKTNKDLYNSEFHLFKAEDDTNKLVSFLTPPWPMIIYSETIPNNTFISEFIDFLKQKQITLTGINARRDFSELFCKKWSDATHCSFEPTMRMTLFVLHELQHISTCMGHSEVANEHDFDQLFTWMKCFHQEVPIGNDDEQYFNSHIRTILQDKNGFLWKDPESVSMVFRERPQNKGVSIGYVYTPKKLRKQGYSTSLVHDVCKRSFDEGYQYCTLFADVNNPTSNSIYKKIGFQEICEYAIYTFK